MAGSMAAGQVVGLAKWKRPFVEVDRQGWGRSAGTRLTRKFGVEEAGGRVFGPVGTITI